MTIEEMADQYSNDIESNYDNDMFDRGDIMGAFENGAKAVLEEIERVIDLGEPPYLISTDQAYYQIKQKILELKG